MSETTSSADATSLRTRIQTVIEASTSAVNELVVNYFVKQETDRRTALIVDGLKRLGDAEKAHEAIKADHRIFGEGGEVLQFGFSAEQKGKKDKARKKLDRLSDALNEAISSGKFKALEDALKQND